MRDVPARRDKGALPLHCAGAREVRNHYASLGGACLAAANVARDIAGLARLTGNIILHAICEES